MLDNIQRLRANGPGRSEHGNAPQRFTAGGDFVRRMGGQQIIHEQANLTCNGHNQPTRAAAAITRGRHAHSIRRHSAKGRKNRPCYRKKRRGLRAKRMTNDK